MLKHGETSDEKELNTNYDTQQNLALANQVTKQPDLSKEPQEFEVSPDYHIPKKIS